jgi:RpiR family carbohydrate utilization transcriptional regulator
MMLSQLEEMREQLRPSERKLADYVIEAPREVLDLSMNEVAARAGVSQPTIARFCHALGFSGFREFKIRLAQGIAAEVPAVYREPAPGVAAKVLDRTIGALIQVRNNLSSDSVAAAIALLAKARRIEFYGAGGSGIAALDVQHKFFRLGMPSVAYSDPHTFLMSAPLLGEGDVVVVIAITHGNSPLARLATVGLFANVDEDTDIFSPMTSRVSHLAIGDILAVGVALSRGPELVEKMAQAKEVINRRRIDPRG